MALRHLIVGRLARAWWFVTRPRTFGVRALVLDGEGRIALVRHSYLKGGYLPGGGVEKGEGAAAAITRELVEEVALSGCTVERVLGVYHARREYKDDHVVVFVMRAPKGAALRPDAREIEEAGWFAADALPEGVSPATGRRIGEFLRGVTGSGDW